MQLSKRLGLLRRPTRCLAWHVHLPVPALLHWFLSEGFFLYRERCNKTTDYSMDSCCQLPCNAFAGVFTEAPAAALRSSVCLTSRHHSPTISWSTRHNTTVWNSRNNTTQLFGTAEKNREISNKHWCLCTKKNGSLSLLRPWCLQDTHTKKTCENVEEEESRAVCLPSQFCLLAFVL